MRAALTDQVGHRLNNVNLGVWSTELTAIEAAAYDVTYAGDTHDASRQGGGPIMMRTDGTAAAAVVATPGRTVSLGTVQLARQGLVSSAIHARLAKAKPVRLVVSKH